MERPFVVHINLSNILKDHKQTHYVMYIDDTKMTIVYELIEWIQWIFSLTHCIYLTHKNSVIHELEDIKILSVLNNIMVLNCDHFPCVHTKLNHLFKKMSFFVQWNGIKVPKLFLNKVNEITAKLAQKDGSVGIMINGCSEEETARPNEVEKIESKKKVIETNLGNNSTCATQISANLNSNVCGSNKANFNVNSKMKLGDTSVGMSSSNIIPTPCCDKFEFVHLNGISKSNFMTSDVKYDTVVGINNTNLIQPDENESIKAPIKISKSEIEEIKSLVNVNVSDNIKCSEYEEINKSNRKRLQSISDDKKFNGNKIVKKGFKPFSVGEILTSLRSELNSSSNNHELNNPFSTEQSQNCSFSKGLTNDSLECDDQNFPNNYDLTCFKMKRKRVRKHKSKKLNLGDSKLDNLLSLPKHEGGEIPGNVKLYTPHYTKQSSHIRFTSDDDEDFSQTNSSKPDKQPEITQHDPGKSNELVENGMEWSSLINGNEEDLSVTQPDACNKNVESKVDDFSERNKEFSTLDKLIHLNDPKSSSDSLLECLNAENEHTNGAPKTPDNYDFNLSTLKALKEKFPSPMVVERFY